MSDYTPTTEEVRIRYSMDEKYCDEAIEAKWAAEFDRWLAAHDAEMRADEREEVLDRQKAAMFNDFRTNADGNLVLYWETAASAARGDGEQT